MLRATDGVVMSRLVDYATAIVSYWQFWIAVAFWIERALERYLPTSTTKKFNELLPAARRRPLFLWIAAFAFCYANFRAWDIERSAKETAIAGSRPARLNPSKLYQDGFEIADVDEPKIDAGNQTLTFPRLSTIRLDPNREIEYSNWKILCTLDEKKWTGTSGTPQGPVRQYAGIICKIQGHR